MTYTIPEALPPAALAVLDKLRAEHPRAADIIDHVALALYRCGHVDGFGAGAELCAREALAAIDAKIAELKGAVRG